MPILFNDFIHTALYGAIAYASLHATDQICRPHAADDEGHHNKNYYSNSDCGKPTPVNPISYVRAHAQSESERKAVDDPSQVHRHLRISALGLFRERRCPVSICRSLA